MNEDKNLDTEIQKGQVRDFWNEASCGEELYLSGEDERQMFINQMNERYRLEPFIIDFANFNGYQNRKVLEIGVGLGADHQRFAEGRANLSGIDLTPRAVEFTRRRLSLFNLKSDVFVGDSENLQFSNDEFDLVYSWGVIHHSPDTPKCIREIFRILKKGGEFKIMIYHKHSMIGYMLWLRYALFKMKPFISLTEIYSKYLESPGTKAYTVKEAKQLFKDFNEVKIRTLLGHGDLLSSQAGQRHKGFILSLARILYPRSIIKLLFPSQGLFMLIEGRK